MKAFIGIAPCGCVRAAVMDYPGEEMITQQDVASFKDSGLRIEEVEEDEARHRMGHNAPCMVHQKKRGRP